MLSDMGAEVIRIERSAAVAPGDPNDPPKDVLARGRRSIGVDLKNPDGLETVMKLVEQADIVMEGFRPGVTERLGLGPDDCMARNPKIVYGRMTGWGQEGPYMLAAGHDINYIALAGALAPIGRNGEAPVPPLNLVGDFGGGGMYLAFGLVCGLLEARQSGEGQVVDTAMVDGAASLMNMFWGMKASGVWNDERGTNMLDTGSHFYDVYECSDGEYISIGSIEPQFYAELMQLSGLGEQSGLAHQNDRPEWPAMKQRVTDLFKTKTRAEWCTLMEHSDVCFAPVLSMDEATQHPHNVERGTFIEVGGMTQAAPAPRFSRTSPSVQGPASHPGADTDSVLADYGFDADTIAKLRDVGAVA
jgi:alpha-methylacyl-CoA racemase